MGQFDQEIEESMGEVQRGMEPISPAEVPSLLVDINIPCSAAQL